MEQKISVDISTEKLEDTNNSPPQKRAKCQPKENLPPLEATSINAAETNDSLMGTNHLLNQQPKNSVDADYQQPSRNGIFNFVLPSEEDCALAPEENLEPNSAGLKSSRTGGVWHKSLEESHPAQVKEKSLLGHLVCSEETQRKILEPDIFRILGSEGVTEIGALYKVSPSKFVLVFGSKAAKEKLEGTEIQCCFADSEICLNFCKRVGPLRNGREPIFVTILLPEFISNQAVRLAFSSFGEVVTVFKRRHKINKKIRNGKRHVKIFSAGEDPAILPRKIFFHVGSKGMFSSRKRWCCATDAKLGTCLARIALWLHPSQKILACL